MKDLFELSLNIEIGDEHLAKCIFRSIKPDLKAEGLGGVDVDILLRGSQIIITVSSQYYGRFRGVYNNILRLIAVLTELHSAEQVG
jgi:tRNA threonylcarbamoyladenosine modification (KEOPS) complex  Pcc1 subunit